MTATQKLFHIITGYLIASIEDMSNNSTKFKTLLRDSNADTEDRTTNNRHA